MNLVSLLIATSVVKYSHNVGLRVGVSIVAIAIVVAAVVISKRRSSGLSTGEPTEGVAAVTASGPGSASVPSPGGDNGTAPAERSEQTTT